MNEFEIIRIEPLNLPADIVWNFCYRRNVPLKDFVVYIANKENKMYVIKTVPEEDIKKFIEVITFPDFWVNDDDYGMGEYLEYVYKRYGYPAYSELIDSHAFRMEKEKENKAREKA